MARLQDYRDLYTTFRDERADLITRQKVERSELQSQWRKLARQNDRTAPQDKRVSDNSSARSLQNFRAGAKGRKMNNEEQSAENKMKSFAQAPPLNSQFELAMETQARSRGDTAQANQKTPQKTVKQNVVVKGRRAAEKRSLQDQSITRAQARKALSSIREERAAKVSRKAADRER